MTFKFISRAYIVSTFTDYEKKNRWDNIYRKLYIETKNQENEMNLSYDQAMTDVNFIKNRYQNVLPYDQNRVKLKTKKNGQTDFINASPLKIPFANRDYILSQGPLDTTSGDFWQMIWEQNTRIIVMLNNIYEKGSMKCFPYFSTEDENEKTFGDFTITLDEETGTEIFRIRTMTLTANDQIHVVDGESNQRTIHHFQFIDWPDFGVPSETGSFLDFCQHVSDAEEKLRKEETISPVVVHCSAGIGRSGAFVVVDSLLNYFQKSKTNSETQEIETNEEIHVPATLDEFVLQIRKYRTGLIQTPEQLRFCWQSLNDWIKSHPDDDDIQPAELLPRKRQSTSESIEIRNRKQKIQEMREKLRKVEEYKKKWYRRWLDDEQKRFWFKSSLIALGAVIATYVYTCYISKNE